MRIHPAALTLAQQDAALRNFKETIADGNDTTRQPLQENHDILNLLLSHPLSSLTPSPPSQISVPLTKLPQAKVKRPSIGNSFALELPDNTNPLSNAAPPNFSDWPSYKFLLLIETSCPGGGLHIVTQFTDEGGLSDEEGPQFNNLVVDKNTGRVYIGAVNKLYQLSPNLEQMVRDDTVITYSSSLASKIQLNLSATSKSSLF